MSARLLDPAALSVSLKNGVAAAAIGVLAATAGVAAAADPVIATPVVTLVKVAAPWYAPRFYLVRRFRETVPEYEAIPGLLFKIYTLSDDAKFGGLYLWRDMPAARAWFDDAWFANVLEKRGVPAEVRYFEAPVIVDNAAGDPPANGRAVATVVTIPVPPGATRETIVAGFRKAVPVYEKVPGLLRKYFVLTHDGQFGGIYLWADGAAADRHYDDAWRTRVRAAYGMDATIERFDAPVLTRSRLPENRALLVQP